MINMIKPIIVEAISDNPWYNLALEEHLFNTINPDEVIFYLWQNNNTVVIGRNQNAWKECDCERLENDGGKLVRRLSGGGAVYHDLGNLNFTFIMHKNNYNMEKQLSVLKNSLKYFNINAEFSGRNDMLIGGKKFSGHAYYFKDNKAYHHGTLMVNSDLDKLSMYLNPSKKKIESKGVDSVKSRVTNISSVDKDINVYKLSNALKRSFEDSYGDISKHRIYDSNDKDVLALQDKYSSWDWIYGKSPKFDMSFSDRFAWGEIEITMSLQNGRITDMQVYTDAMDAELFEGFTTPFIGIKISKRSFLQLCERYAKPIPEHIRRDLTSFMNSLDINP